MNLWARIKRRCVYMYRYSGIVLRMIIHPQERKYIFNWMESLQRKHSHYLLDHSMPFICYTAWEYIANRFPKDALVFEYGSGGSTLFWLETMKAQCISIEHDPRWYKLVQDRVEQLKLSNRLDYRLVQPDSSPALNSQPSDRLSPYAYLDEKVSGYFERYVKQIDEFEDGHFQIVIIDGRSRPACIAHAIPKICPGGMLIVDNSDRPYFAHLRQVLADFEEKCFVGVVPTSLDLAQTSIFIRRRSPEGAQSSDNPMLKTMKSWM